MFAPPYWIVIQKIGESTVAHAALTDSVTAWEYVRKHGLDDIHLDGFMGIRGQSVSQRVVYAIHKLVKPGVHQLTGYDFNGGQATRTAGEGGIVRTLVINAPEPPAALAATPETN